MDGSSPPVTNIESTPLLRRLLLLSPSNLTPVTPADGYHGSIGAI